MWDAGGESHLTHPKTLYPGWKFVEVPGTEQGDWWLVGRLDVKFESNEIICKAFTCPSYAQCFLVNLVKALFCRTHIS